MQRALTFLGSALLVTALASGCESCGSCGWDGGSHSYHNHSAPVYGGPTPAPQSGGVYYESAPQTAPSTNGSSAPSYSAPVYEGSGTR